MSRNQFDEVLRYLHLADNCNYQENDKRAKVRPIYDMMSKKFLQPFQMEEQPCVGESVIPYYGKYSAKQYVKGKPFKFGYKIWFINTSQGYLLHYNLYAGRGNQNPMLGLGELVVNDLVATLPKLHWKTTFDNFFTSLNLLHHLSKHCVVGIGTLRANRTDKCPITDRNVIGKENRRSYDYRYDAANKMNNGEQFILQLTYICIVKNQTSKKFLMLYVMTDSSTIPSAIAPSGDVPDVEESRSSRVQSVKSLCTLVALKAITKAIELLFMID